MLLFGCYWLFFIFHILLLCSEVLHFEGELSKNVEIQLKNMGSQVFFALFECNNKPLTNVQPQTTKLLQEVEPTSGDNPVVVTLPPQWVSTVDQISVQMDTIKHKSIFVILSLAYLVQQYNN